MVPALDPSRWQGWLPGLASNVLNPQAGIFYVAVIPQFLPAGTSPLPMGAVLAGVHCVLLLAWCAVLILGSGYARRRLNTPRSPAAVDRLTGMVLLGFGGKLILDPLPAQPVAAAVLSPRPVRTGPRNPCAVISGRPGVPAPGLTCAVARESPCGHA